MRFIVPGYIGNQRIEATRRRRARTLSALFVGFWSVLALAAVLASLFSGCGDDKAEGDTVQEISIEVPLFQVSPVAPFDPGVRTLDMLATLPRANVAYAIELFARPATGQPAFPYEAWGVNGGPSPVAWRVYALSEAGGTRFPAIRVADGPDAWEDSGTLAGVLEIRVTLNTFNPWTFGVTDPMTILVRLVVRPAIGQCFTNQQWADVAAQVNVTNPVQGPLPLYKAT